MPYKNVRLTVTAIISRFGKTPKGWDTFLLESVMFDDILVRDHIWIKGRTGKGKWQRVKLYAKVGTYIHNGVEKYCLSEYRFV